MQVIHNNYKIITLLKEYKEHQVIILILTEFVIYLMKQK